MLQLKIEAIKWETLDTATFFLGAVPGKKIIYQAGQFITLVFTHHDEEIRRSYSLSSSPDEQFLAITIKRITNGEISRFILSKLKPGDIISAIEPAGRFTIDDSVSAKDIFLFAAGSGITPVFAQLKYALARPGNSQFILIYSNQNLSAILFKQELDDLAATHPGRLSIIYLLSAEGRRLNNVLAEQLVKKNIHYELDKAEFYLCGPFAYMRMVRLTLLFMGIGAARIRKENFVIETIPVIHDHTTYAPHPVKITFKGELYDIIVGENQSILQAALQNNIQLPYSCRAGVCSACMAQCISGKIVMTENEVLTEQDLSHGLILTCTGHPVGDDVTLTFDQ